MSLDSPEIAGLVFGSLIVVGLGYKGIEYMQGSNDDRYNQTKEETAHNVKVFKLSSTIDDREWRELWNIFKGQSMIDFKKYMKELPKEEQTKAWEMWYNGSDMRGWWD
jgi:hypothetical protein